ncbi:MAG: hypothetical protein WBW53_06570 [Terriglobales bacterium]
MNAILFLRRFPWLPALGILTFSGALVLCNWLVWTPIERYYLGTYLKCAMLGTDRGSSAEVQWLYKTAPPEKQELALDTDVVPASSGDDRRIPMELSPAARQAGWTGLVQGPDEWLRTARLQTFLQAEFYAGESVWRVLLRPLLWGAAMFLFLLAAYSMLPSRPQYEPWDVEAIDWGRPPPSLLQRWRTKIRTRAKIGRIRLRLPGLAKQKMPEIAPTPTPPAPDTAPPDPPKTPNQPVLALFGSAMGAPKGKPKEGFRWEETKGIE